MGVGRSSSWLPVGQGEISRLCHNTPPSLESLRQRSHLLRSAGSRHAPHHFDSHWTRNPATDQTTTAPRNPLTSLPNPPLPPYTTITASKSTGLPVTTDFYTKTFLLISMSDREQNSGALRSQVQNGRGLHPPGEVPYLKPIRQPSPPWGWHTHRHNTLLLKLLCLLYDTILVEKEPFPFPLERPTAKSLLKKKLLLSPVPKGKKKSS